MDKINKMREIYESTEIPEELDERVERAFESAQREVAGEYTVSERYDDNLSKDVAKNEKRARDMFKRKRIYRRFAAGVAAVAVMTAGFGIGVVKSEAFAASVSDIPILGAFARVLTGEEINKYDDYVDIKVKLPKIEGLSDKAVESRINKEIRDKMIVKVAEAEKRAIGDKKAWIATGGDPNEYIPRPIYVDYEVKVITEEILSFIVSEMEVGANAYYELYYYNIDLNTNEELTLEDLLGKDYIEIADTQIKNEITVRSKNPENMYFDGSDGIDGFRSISAGQGFYVNEKGNPVIVFNKYEIAPGYMGIQEFEIVK